jgi:putative FmdB family regulatory protein
MPTYEYRCPNGHRFEKLQKMSDKTRVKCPTCGKMAERMISGGAGLVFKGSGFYITDYGKDGKGPRKPAPESGTTSESKSDKPEAKSEPKSETKPDSPKGSKSPTSESKSTKKNSTSE